MKRNPRQPKRTLAVLVAALLCAALAVPVGAFSSAEAAPTLVNAPGGEDALPETGEAGEAPQPHAGDPVEEPGAEADPPETAPSEAEAYDDPEPTPPESPGEAGEVPENPGGETGDGAGEPTPEPPAPADGPAGDPETESGPAGDGNTQAPDGDSTPNANGQQEAQNGTDDANSPAAEGTDNGNNENSSQSKETANGESAESEKAGEDDEDDEENTGEDAEDEDAKDEDADEDAGEDDEDEDDEDEDDEDEDEEARARAALLDRLPVDITTLFDAVDPPVETILTAFSLTFTDADGNITDTPTINDEMKVYLAFLLPEELCDLMIDGDWYDIAFSGVTFSGALDIPLIFEGVPIAHVTSDGENTIRLTFTSYIDDYNDIRGEVEFWGAIDEALVEVGENEIFIYGEETIPPAKVVIRPATGTMLDKSARLDRLANPQYITWTVDANKSLESLTGVTIADNIPAGLALESVKVEAATVTPGGEIVEGSLTEIFPPAFTQDPDGTLHFATLDTALRITYLTRIEDENAQDTTLQYDNTVTLTADGLDPVQATAPAFATFGTALGKEATGYNSATQTITWAIYFNYNERILNDAWITDTFGDTRMSLVDGSVTIFPVTFDEKTNEGIPDRNNALPGGAFTVTPTNPDGTGGFTLSFTDTITGAYYIEFKTRLSGIMDGSTTFYNYVTDQSGNDAEAWRTVGQGSFYKALTKLDPANKVASWLVRVNAPRYDMHNVTVTDTFGPGLTWLDEEDGYPFAVRDVDTGLDLQEGTHYTVNRTGGGFTLEFIGGYERFSTCVEITFHTRYHAQQIPGGRVGNTASSTWYDEDDNKFTHSDYDSRQLNSRDIYNGSKSASYNYQTREITWTIHAGYSATGMGGAYIEDTLEQNQTYVPESLTIGRFTIDGEGEIQYDTPLEDWTGFTVEEPAPANGNTLRVDLPDDMAEPGMYWVEFRTSLEGEVIEGRYENTAYFYNDGYETRPLTAGVDIAYGGALAAKTGETLDGNRVWWNITVNPTRSTLYDTVVCDEPSANQLIDFDQLAVYGAIINDKGEVTRDPNTILDPGEYTATYTPDANGNWCLRVELPAVITEPYIIRYPVTVMTELQNGEEALSNAVTISSYNREELEQTITKTVNVEVSGGGGVIYGSRSGFVLRKLSSETNEPLSGATFILKNKEGRQIGGEFTTDESGEITIGNLVWGEYTIFETTAPEGHSVLPLLAKGYTVMVDENSLNRGNMVTLYNDPTAVTLQKQQEDGTPLSGATFRLEMLAGEDVWGPYRAGDSFTTDEDGLLTITALPAGTYRLIETRAPSGYLLDATPVEFTLEADEDGYFEPLMLGPVTNYRNSAEVTKAGPDGERLAGSEFMLEKWVPAGEEEDEDVAIIYHPVKERVTAIQPAALEAEGEWVRLYEDATLVTGEDGLLTVQGLAPGTYRFTEIASPTGYKLDPTPLEFTIDQTTTGVVSAGTHYNWPVEADIIPDPAPDPDPAPNPAPDPDPDPAPNPAPDPDPDPAPGPDPKADPEPDPDPDPDPGDPVPPPAGTANPAPATVLDDEEAPTNRPSLVVGGRTGRTTPSGASGASGTSGTSGTGGTSGASGKSGGATGRTGLSGGASSAAGASGYQRGGVAKTADTNTQRALAAALAAGLVGGGLLLATRRRKKAE